MFQSINEITFEKILQYCKGKNDTQWLKDLLNKDGLTNKNGKPRKTSFIEVRQAFVFRYEEFASLRPQKTEKKPTMYDLIKDL